MYTPYSPRAPSMPAYASPLGGFTRCWRGPSPISAETYSPFSGHWAIICSSMSSDSFISSTRHRKRA
jgi:hypothetical protein